MQGQSATEKRECNRRLFAFGVDKCCRQVEDYVIQWLWSGLSLLAGFREHYDLICWQFMEQKQMRFLCWCLHEETSSIHSFYFIITLRIALLKMLISAKTLDIALWNGFYPLMHAHLQIMSDNNTTSRKINHVTGVNDPIMLAINIGLIGQKHVSITRDEANQRVMHISYIIASTLMRFQIIIFGFFYHTLRTQTQLPSIMFSCFIPVVCWVHKQQQMKYEQKNSIRKDITQMRNMADSPDLISKIT